MLPGIVLTGFDGMKWLTDSRPRTLTSKGFAARKRSSQFCAKIFVGKIDGGKENQRHRPDLMIAATFFAHLLYSFPEGCRPSSAISAESRAACLVLGVILR